MRARGPTHTALLAFARRLRAYLPPGTLGDTLYSTLRYIVGQRRIPRYRNPRLFNDCLFRLRNDGTLLSPLRQFVTDKEYVKAYIGGTVGWQYAVPTLAIARSDEEIDKLSLSSFPCVIKPAHMSGQVILVRDENEEFDRAVLKRWLRTDYYLVSRESNYRYLEPKILVEDFFDDSGRPVPRDFKVHCFGGVPRLIQVDSGRFASHTRNWYDVSWKRLDLEWAYPQGHVADARPKCLDVMLELARSLSHSLSYIRVDMYTDDSTVKVGELTSCPDGAKRRMRPRSVELWIGELLAGELDRGV